MSKSRKKPDSEVDSDPAVSASPATLIENEKQVVSKKQKVDNGDKEHEFEKKNFGKETEENTKKEQNNSSEDNKVDVPPAIESTPTTQDLKRARISNDHEEEERDNNFKVDHQHLETLMESDQTPLSSEAPGSKTLLMDNLSFLIQEKDVKTFFKNVGEISEIHFDMKDDYFTGHGHVEFTTAEAAQEAVKLNNTSLLDKPVKLNLATKRDEHPPSTSHATGSKTLYLGNLSFSIEEDDVRDLFKDVGEIKSIRFAIKNDRFLGHGYIEFTTVEAAQEALKLNNTVILDRKVKLDLARERGSHTPSTSSFEKYNQRGGHAQGRSLYVRGFDYSHGYENVRSSLEKHFGKCGEISRISIPQDYESGGPRGVAFIDFADSKAFSEALRLDRSQIGGCRIIVEEAKKKRGDGREGFGYGGGSGGGWGREGGSGGGWGRENGSGGGESGSGSAWSRRNDYGGGSDRASGGSGGGWGRENSSGGGESGSGSGWSRGNDYGGSSGRATSGSGGGWHREGGWHGDGDWRREGGYRGILGRGGGYGGDGFSSSRVGRFSGGSRGGGGSRA